MIHYFLIDLKQKKYVEFFRFSVNPQIHKFYHKENKKNVQII